MDIGDGGALDDLARLHAIEHLVVCLWTFYAYGEAAPRNMSVEAAARELQEGVLGTLAEGRGAEELRTLIRLHARLIMDRVVENARTMDELRGRGAP